VITIGLIGCGGWGKNILRDLLRLHCTVYVVDIDSQARSRACELGAAHAYGRIDELPPCSGYIVAVPIPDLTKECAALLKFKKPVFSEKTLCLSMDDYHRLKKSDGSTYIFAMHKWHYHPGIEALRSVAQSGKIGDIEQLCATRHGWVNDFHGGDVFWTQAVHDLTIVKHILGYIPDKVKSVHIIKNQDGLPVSLTAVLGDKPAAILSVSGQHCDKISGVSIHGNQGSAGLYNALDDHITVRTAKGEEKIPIDTTFPLYLELKEFTEYLNHGPRPRCNLENAKEVTRVILKIRKKAGL
jgi:predicted dehydrogenase